MAYQFSRINNYRSRPGRVAETFVSLGSGNCDYLGATAYAPCRNILDGNYWAAWVAVDPWPLEGHAVFLSIILSLMRRKNLEHFKSGKRTWIYRRFYPG